MAPVMDAFAYLETLPGATVDRLYEDPWACQAVFQSLPSLAQQFLLRLLTCETSISVQMLQAWLRPMPTADSKQKVPPAFQIAINKLLALRVFLQETPTTYRLNQHFVQQLRYALSHLGGSPWEAGRQKLPTDGDKFSPADLEKYARSRWDSVLHFMVGSTAVKDPPQLVIDILLRTELMQQSGNGSALHITNTGYEFMLKDVHAQMWTFMLEYIKTIDEAGMLQKEDILNFLFQISYCQTNQYYATSDLTEPQQRLLGDFTNFGLLYRQRHDSDRFYTTSFAVNLIFGGASGQMRNVAPSLEQGREMTAEEAVDAGAELLVVVETNFKVYAYTTSSLHIAMLSVFVDLVAKLPNLAIGFITRESLRSALINGISAQQIYDFLMKHAHPKMKLNSPVIPENIADQIYLWERERNRVQFFEGLLFDGFNSKEDYEKVIEFANKHKVLTWSDPVHFKLTVATAGVDRVRDFIQNNLTA